MDQLSELLAEMERRRSLEAIIDKVVTSGFDFVPTSYIRRGRVQGAVASILKVTQNNKLARAVIDYLASKGVEPVMIKGKQYFRGLRVK